MTFEEPPGFWLCIFVVGRVLVGEDIFLPLFLSPSPPPFSFTNLHTISLQNPPRQLREQEEKFEIVPFFFPKITRK